MVYRKDGTIDLIEADNSALKNLYVGASKETFTESFIEYGRKIGVSPNDLDQLVSNITVSYPELLKEIELVQILDGTMDYISQSVNIPFSKLFKVETFEDISTIVSKAPELLSENTINKQSINKLRELTKEFKTRSSKNYSFFSK